MIIDIITKKDHFSSAGFVRQNIVDEALTYFSDKTKLRLARAWAENESIENEAKDKDKLTLPPPGGKKREKGWKERGEKRGKGKGERGKKEKEI